MATQLLRPLAFGEILDGSFSIYRREFGTLVSIAVVCQGIPAALGVYVQITGGLIAVPGLLFFTWGLYMLGGLLAAGATLFAISETYLGREPEFGTAMRQALRHVVRLFLAGLMKYVLVFAGLMFFLIPGFIIFVAYAVVFQVVVLEQGHAVDALRRSWNLTRGFRLRAFGLFVVVSIIVNIPSYVAGVIGAVFVASAPTVWFVSLAIGAAITLLLYPLVSCAMTLYYYDLRVRKEAFDLQLLSEQLEMAGG